MLPPHIISSRSRKKHTFTIPALGKSDFTLPADIKMVDESAFEGTGVTVLCAPDGCESIGKDAYFILEIETFMVYNKIYTDIFDIGRPPVEENSGL